MRISDWTSDVCSSDLKGANHCPGNIFIYAPAQKVLTKIDIVSPGTTPFFHCDASENISGYIDAHRQILEYDFDYLVGGHVRRWGTRADVDTALEYFQDMVNFSHDVLKTMRNRETAVKFLSNPEQYWEIGRASFRERGGRDV